MALAERALGTRVRPAACHSAETGPVARLHARLVLAVGNKVVPLLQTPPPVADCIVVAKVVRVHRTKVASAILAGLDRDADTARESSP